jgi:hypothetical protein
VASSRNICELVRSRCSTGGRAAAAAAAAAGAGAGAVRPPEERREGPPPPLPPLPWGEGAGKEGECCDSEGGGGGLTRALHTDISTQKQQMKHVSMGAGSRNCAEKRDTLRLSSLTVFALEIAAWAAIGALPVRRCHHRHHCAVRPQAENA